MKNLRISAVAGALLSALCATTAIAAPYCKTMEVYLSNNPKHRDDVTAQIAPKLKEKFGTDLVLEQMSSAAMFEKVAAQGSQPRVSLIFPDFPISASSCDTLCDPFDTKKISTVGSYPESARIYDKNGGLVGISTAVNAVGLVYNEDEFKKRGLALPTSWEDLNRKDLTGRVSINSPVGVYGVAIVAALSQVAKAAPGNYDPAFAWVKKLQPNLHSVHTFTGELGNLMQLKEVWLSSSGTNIIPVLRENGVPAKFVTPKEGGILIQNGVSMVKNAPCQEETYAFLNMYLSDDFQALRAKTAGNITPSTTAWSKISPEVVASLPMDPAEMSKMLNFDWKKLGPDRNAIVERWQREIR